MALSGSLQDRPQDLAAEPPRSNPWGLRCVAHGVQRRPGGHTARPLYLSSKPKAYISPAELSQGEIRPLGLARAVPMAYISPAELSQGETRPLGLARALPMAYSVDLR